MNGLPPPREDTELAPEDQIFRRNIDKVLSRGLTIRWPHRPPHIHVCELLDRNRTVVSTGDDPDPNKALVQAAKNYHQHISQGLPAS